MNWRHTKNRRAGKFFRDPDSCLDLGIWNFEFMRTSTITSIKQMGKLSLRR